MGLWSTIRDALGLQPPLRVVDPTEPLALSPAAQARLEALPEGQGVHVATAEVPGGRVVQVTEGELQGPAAPGFEAWPLTASDADLERLRGPTLDLRGDRWVVAFPLELRARETPSPGGRRYLASTPLGEGKPAFFVPPAEEGLPARLLAIPSVVSVLFRENTVTVEREPGTPWDRIDRAVDEILTELHEALEASDGEIGEEARQELRTAAAEIREAIEAGDEVPDSLRGKLSDAIERFEEQHPTLTNIVGRVADALADMGI